MITLAGFSIASVVAWAVALPVTPLELLVVALVTPELLLVLVLELLVLELVLVLLLVDPADPDPLEDEVVGTAVVI